MSAQTVRGARTRTRWAILTVPAALALALVALLVSYHFRRTLAVDVGSLWDIPLVSGFNADEADISYRYRWTSGHSEVYCPEAGSDSPFRVTVWAQGPRLTGQSQPITMSVSVNGSLLRYAGVAQQGDVGPPLHVTLTEQLQPYAFFVTVSELIDGIPPGSDYGYTVGIDTSTFRPPGDERTLGAKVSRVEFAPSGADTLQGINSPPFSAAFWLLVTVLGLFGIFSPMRRPWSSILPYVGVLLLCVLLFTARLYAAVLMPPAGVALGLLGLLVWQRERVRRWPDAVESLRSGSWASLIMAAALAIYALVALSTLSHVDAIGHADYAENAVIARNLLSGRGLTVDYSAQFYRDYGPGLSHPADTWPLLQPILIAPFFVLFGAVTWAAKLPNLLLVLGLAWAVFALTSRLWDARVGLLAGLLALLHPYFFNAVLYPINDLAFTLIFFLLAWLAWHELSPVAGSERFPTWAALAARLHRRRLFAIGALSGLLVWSKPSGAALLVGLALCALWVWWRRSGAGKRAVPWKPLAWAGGALVLVLLPLVVRNLLAFGVPFYSTESTDVWILRYWPLHNWEDIYKVYFGQELPHPRWVVGGKFGYQNLVDAVLGGFGSLWQKGILADPGQGDSIIGLLPLWGALVGLAASVRRVQSLFAMVGLCMGLYALFVLLYWHFEGRYFQVAVPWLYMLLAWGVFWVFDRLHETRSPEAATRSVDAQAAGPSPSTTRSVFGALVLPLAVAGLIWPSLSAIGTQIESDSVQTGFVAGMAWLKDHSSPQDVVMTRDPWELNWHTSRKAVMIPNDDLTTIERIMKRYGVTLLQLGGPVDGIDVRRCPGTVGSRPALGRLYCGEERAGFKLLYRQGGLTVYRVSSTR